MKKLRIRLKESGEKTAFIKTVQGGKSTIDYKTDQELKDLADNQDIAAIKTASGKNVKGNLEEEIRKYTTEESGAVGYEVAKSLVKVLRAQGNELSSLKLTGVGINKFNIHVEYGQGKGQDTFKFILSPELKSIALDSEQGPIELCDFIITQGNEVSLPTPELEDKLADAMVKYISGPSDEEYDDMAAMEPPTDPSQLNKNIAEGNSEEDIKRIKRYIEKYEVANSDFERIYKQMQNAVNDPKTTDPTRLIFKHELSLMDKAKAFVLQSMANQDRFEADREGMNEDDHLQPDDESSMAKAQLKSIQSNASKLMDLLGDDDQLDAWVQAKLTKAEDYLDAVAGYTESEKEDQTPTTVTVTLQEEDQIKEGKSNAEVDKLLKVINTKKAGPEYKKALMDLIAMAEKKSGKTINTKKAALQALDYIEPTIKEEVNVASYGKVIPPKGGGSLVGKYSTIEGKSQWDYILFDHQPDSDKPYGVVLVSGHKLDSGLMRELGLRETSSNTAGVEVYIYNGNYNPLYLDETDFTDLLDNWSGGLGREAQAQRDFYSNRQEVDEADINDPLAIKYRAAMMKKNTLKKPNPAYLKLKNADKISALEKHRAQLMIDMEQEAEPEGGPIADKYGRELNKIDAALNKLKGIEESINEKTLTKAETEKREEIVKAMKKQGAKKDAKTYAIATAAAKKLAEDTSISKEELHQLILEAYVEVLREEETPALKTSTQEILGKFPTVKKTLVSLLTPEYDEFVEDVKWTVPKPSTFKVVLKNGQSLDLKWMGKDFQASIEGKRYYLGTTADYQQALDSLNRILRDGPITQGEEPGGEDFAAEPAAGGGTGGDFPGADAGGEGEVAADEFGAEEGGEEAPAEAEEETPEAL